MIQRTLALLLFFAPIFLVFAQERDTTLVQRDTTLVDRDTSIVISNDRIELFTELSDLNPKKAAFMSAVLPGLGQVYNRQYWKLPFVYGGAVIIGHYIRYQDRLLKSFRSAYLAEVDADPGTINPYTGLGATTLERNVQQLRRDRDYLMIIGGLFYLLQIADAHISAHLHEFQINEELSMNIGPSIQPSALISRSVGVSVSLNFK